MYALIEPSGRVAQVAESTFPIADPLRWVEAGSEVNPSYRYENGQFTAPPEKTLEGAKIVRLSEITLARNAALIALTASWDGDLWDADEATSARIANALSMVREATAIGIPAPASIPWRTADNKDRTLTIAELTQMGAAVFLAQQMVWAKQAQLKNAIASAQTVEAVEGINW